MKKQLQKYQGAPRMSTPPEPVIEDEEIVKKKSVLKQMKKVDDPRKRTRDECKSWEKNLIGRCRRQKFPPMPLIGRPWRLRPSY